MKRVNAKIATNIPTERHELDFEIGRYRYEGQRAEGSPQQGLLTLDQNHGYKHQPASKADIGDQVGIDRG